MFLSFNNGKKVDLSMLKEGMELKDDNLFKSYDKNNNSIFEADELAQLQEDLTNAAGEDAVLSENEAVSFFAKIMNSTTQKIQELLKKEKENDPYKAIETLFIEQAKSDALAKMQADIDNAIEIYCNSLGGSITKGCNSLKELFNTEYAASKVYRQIINKQVSTLLLKKADSEDGLTKKEYIEEKITFLVALLGGDALSQEEIEVIRNGLLKSTGAELDEYLKRLVNADDENYVNVINQTISELDEKTNSFNLSPQEISYKSVNPNSIEAIIFGKEGDKKLDFKEVYKLENKVDFEYENINDAKNKAQIASLNLSIYTNLHTT